MQAARIPGRRARAGTSTGSAGRHITQRLTSNLVGRGRGWLLVSPADFRPTGVVTFAPTSGSAGNRKLPGMDEDRGLIPEEECWELLASTSVGRVALSIAALPAILPVQYHLDGRTLAVCLGHRELPERALNTIVAFAADAIDPQTRSGWSVQVQGRSMVPHQGSTGNDCGWTTAGQIVQIDPATISGFRMHLCPVIGSLLAQQGNP